MSARGDFYERLMAVPFPLSMTSEQIADCFLRAALVAAGIKKYDDKLLLDLHCRIRDEIAMIDLKELIALRQPISPQWRHEEPPSPEPP